jgi:hypothetical protein
MYLCKQICVHVYAQEIVYKHIYTHISSKNQALYYHLYSNDNVYLEYDMTVEKSFI